MIDALTQRKLRKIALRGKYFIRQRKEDCLQGLWKTTMPLGKKKIQTFWASLCWFVLKKQNKTTATEFKPVDERDNFHITSWFQYRGEKKKSLTGVSVTTFHCTFSSFWLIIHFSIWKSHTDTDSEEKLPHCRYNHNNPVSLMKEVLSLLSPEYTPLSHNITILQYPVSRSKHYCRAKWTNII